MPVIAPFRGIYYNRELAGDLSRVVAPPYDVIGEKQAQDIMDRSPFSVLKLTLGNTLADPRKKGSEDAYVLAARTYKNWRGSGVLTKDEKPAIYAYYLDYKLKTPKGIEQRSRKGLVALLRLSPYSEGSVLPHERTMAGPKQDRFQLLRITRVHMSQIFMLYSDPESLVYQALDQAVSGKEPIQCEDDVSVIHKLWPVHDQQVIDQVSEFMADSTLYIADGHHRYETCLAHQDYIRNKMPLYSQGSDYTMVYLTSIEDPGLCILPYHRLVHGLPKSRFRGFKKKLSEYFEVKPTLLNPTQAGQHRRDYLNRLNELGQTSIAFGMVEGDSGNAYYLTPKNEALKAMEGESTLEKILSNMNVVVLEDLVLTGMLNISRKALLNGKNVNYETDFDKVLDQLKQPENQLAFLLNPIPLGLVTRVARGRGIMPEKSTYFFPKVITGLVMNEMDG